MDIHNNDINLKSACRELIEMVLSNEINNSLSLNAAKKKISKKYKLSSLPRNSDILLSGTEKEQKKINQILQRKPVRTISGVAVIAAMTSPAPCPHGACIPCPGGPNSQFETPQSYMGSEPATMRAIQNKYDPYNSVTSRLSQLKTIGHSVDKSELILMGGTISARSIDYQEWFVKRCIEAMNDFCGKEWRKKANPIGNEYPYFTLEEVFKANEGAKIRNTGITFETRPDWAKPMHVDKMLELGSTKIELGVQSIYDFVLSRVNRGHTVQDTIDANKVIRDSALKIGFHMMLGLPGMSIKRDFESFERLFTESNFMPDYVKIYPTLVTKGTLLYDLWKDGKYNALCDDMALELICRIKSIVPKWVRVQRIQRDIPSHQIFAGVRKSNIGQLATRRLHESGLKCKCIRCREVGHNVLKGVKVNVNDIVPTITEYDACGGKEYFIAFEELNADVLIGFLRLRLVGVSQKDELLGCALVRELRVYGSMVPVGDSFKNTDWQHRGIGRKLLAMAEEIAKGEGYQKIAVLSGIGVRKYYKKLGYERVGVYMVKKI